jgi:hypothetical protein
MIYPRHAICSLSCDDTGEPTSSCHLMTSGAQRLHAVSGIFSFYRKQFACLYFSFIRNRLSGPCSILFNGYRVYFSGIQLLQQEVDNVRPTSAEVKNEWSYNSTPTGTNFLIFTFTASDSEYIIFY